MTFTNPATFVTLQNDVIDKGRLDADQDLNRVKDWINSAYYTACIETNFYESSQTISSPLAAGASAVAVPASIVKIEYITPVGSDGMRWGPMKEEPFTKILELRAYSGGTITTGAPSHYGYRSSAAPTIEFWPNAAGGETLTFYGLSMPTILVNDADPLIFPEPYSKVVEYGALIHAAEFQKDILTLQGFEGQYNDWLQRLRGFNNVKPGSQVSQFRIEGQKLWPVANSVDQGY